MVIALAVAFSVSVPLQADDDALWDQPPIQKLSRGVLNIFDSVVEIPGTMMRMSEEKGAATGMFEGFFIGAVNTVIRAVVGVYEVGTFPFPIPAEYKPILDDPQFMST